MKIKLSEKKLKDIKADCEIVFVVNKNLGHKFIRDKEILNEMNFKGKADEVLLLPEKKRMYVGIGDLELESLRCATALAARTIVKSKITSLKIALYFADDAGRGIKALSEGFLLGAYSYQKYKSKPTKNNIKQIIISSENYYNKKIEIKNLEEKIKEAEIISKSVNFVRDIVNEPPSDLTPLKFSEIAKAEAKENNLTIKILGKKELEKLGMGAFLAVNQASAYPPWLIYLNYKPKNAKKKIILVGKGLTYDTGGLSLKLGDGMLTMKMDMGGAGAILGVIMAISQLKLPIEVQAIIGATENAIGKDAYKPDDVLKAMNGKTIEVRDTDAEGRLVLADCLCYAQKENFDYIIDIATLTGASMVALGEYTSAVMGFNQDLNHKILKSAEKSGELVGILPFNKYLPKLLKSEIADINNLPSSRYGRAITAGLFLGEFIEKRNKKKWAHIDIAGPAFKDKPWGVNPVGASGAGTRLLIEWIKGVL
ncbi:leucyl aminopeptidase [Candidatus Parcubacteria bacterium]|nr:leucyl aminopeptidase [Candidatus Parcubacteria bacterium]